MSQFELVENYLTNRMDDGARSAFEEQMNADPQLKAEVNLQQGIIEGVKTARAAELKAMLNNVPVGGASSAITAKVAIATISAGILGTVLYFGLRSTPAEEMQEQNIETITQQPLTTIEESKEIVESPAESTEKLEVQPEKKQNNTASKEANKNNVEKVAPPQIDVLDLTEDINDNKEDTGAPNPTNKPEISASKVEVELVGDNHNYSFHYQFKDTRLALYGPFDSSLYEIIELNGATHSIFLYYNSSYYHLDDNEQNIVPLIMIRDSVLLSKLEEYRKKN